MPFEQTRRSPRNGVNYRVNKNSRNAIVGAVAYFSGIEPRYFADPVRDHKNTPRLPETGVEALL